MNVITVVGLGPADEQYLTLQTRALLTGDAPVFLRTRQHPAAIVATNAQAFDAVYEEEETFAAVYARIVEELVTAARSVAIVYAVPGSPLVAEHTVELLRADNRVDVTILPAMSFLDLTWQALDIDPLAVSPRIVDGHRFAQEAAGERGPLLVAQCDTRAVLSDIKLAFEIDTPKEAVVLQRLGLPDQSVRIIAWEDLDREAEPDILTSLWIPEAAAPVMAELQRLDEVARRLRVDCPWDAEQTHASLRKYLLEETYEVLEAIDAADGDDTHLIEELGDVLYQVFAHAAVAASEGRFTMADIAQETTNKLIERHPHVYGDVEATTSDDVVATWEANKMKAKGRTSVMDGIPEELPALLYAAKVLKRAKSTGFELASDAAGDGLGAALLLLIDAANSDEEPELALRTAAQRIRDDVRAHEAGTA